MAVSKRTRYEVLRRDNHTCRYCHATDSPLTVDHVTPTALGGTDDPSNLVAACKDCNAGKSSSSPDATLVADARQAELKWAAAMRAAAETLSVHRDREQEFVGEWAIAWSEHTWGSAPKDAEASVARLYTCGLPLEVMLDAVRITGAAYGIHNRFSYFMGICWKRVSEMQETARQLLEAGDA